MRWPWQPNLETRADSSYTDALVAAITANAKGQTTAFPTAIGALESAAGLVGRAFASAVVDSTSSAVLRALAPSCLALIGRSLIRRGEIVFFLDSSHGMIDLLTCCPASLTTLTGRPTRRRGYTVALSPGRI